MIWSSSRCAWRFIFIVLSFGASGTENVLFAGGWDVVTSDDIMSSSSITLALNRLLELRMILVYMLLLLLLAALKKVPAFFDVVDDVAALLDYL